MNHKQKVMIEFNSTQGEDKLTQYFSGEWYLKDKSFFIKYEELTEIGEVRHLLKYESPILKVARKGAVDAEQSFRAYERYKGYYQQGPVYVATEVYTTKLMLQDEFGGVVLGLPQRLPFSLQWEYELFVEGQSTGIFKLCLSVKEAVAS